MNIEHSAICSYENDSQIPTLETAAAMADLFGVSVDYLLAGEKAEVISVKNLTENQRLLITDLVMELSDTTKEKGTFNAKQIELIQRLFSQLQG